MPQTWLIQRLIAPIVRPLTRLIIGLIAIPVLRSVRKKVSRTQEWDDELEKDVEQWFRASLVLLFATKNVEIIIGSWLAFKYNFDLDTWYVLAGRLLLAVSVVETMPDQQLFSIIHSGPPKPHWVKGRGLFGNIHDQWWGIVRGLLCQHLNRSSPVLAIMAAIFDGTIGWVCFCIAIVQYLIIGLVTSRDKALDALSEFDKKVAETRREIVRDFYLEEVQAKKMDVDLESEPAQEDGIES